MAVDPRLEALRRHRTTREITREIVKTSDRDSELDRLRVDTDRKLQGLAQIIDDISRRLSALESKGLLTQLDLDSFAAGLAEAMKRNAA